MTPKSISRFESYINKQPNPTGCWLWTSAKNNNGYGQFWLEGKGRRATWVSYNLYRGKVPLNNMLCHKCDNPSCVNPDHLYLGTNASNMVDMWSRRRRVGRRPTCHPERVHVGHGLCCACYKRQKRGPKYCIECKKQLPKNRAKVCSESCRHNRKIKLQQIRRSQMR